MTNASLGCGVHPSTESRATAHRARRRDGEPQFDAPDKIGHEIIWELTADYRSKHKLLGGADGRAATGSSS